VRSSVPVRSLLALLALGGAAHAGTLVVETAPERVVTIRGKVTRVVTADGNGRVEVTDLPAGEYEIVDGTRATKVRVTDLETAIVWTFDRRYLTDVPPILRTHGFVAGAAAPTNRALEDRYTIDGIETTSPFDRTSAVDLPTELLDQVTVVRGGAGAAYGRSLGGTVAVVTRSGTNEFHGSVFGAWAPGDLVAPAIAEPTPDDESLAISARQQGALLQAGFDLGGPIVRDHAWFYVAVAPRASRDDFTRTIRSRVDFDQDGFPDVGTTGRPLLKTLATEVRSHTTRTVPVIGKLDFAAGAHRASLSAIASAYEASTPDLVGAPSTGTRGWGSTLDATARYSARLRDDRLRVAGALTWHRTRTNTGSFDPKFDDAPQELSNPTLLEGELDASYAGCDRDGDEFPFIRNCPSNRTYYLGGPGPVQRDGEDRKALHLEISHRYGRHELGAGIDAAIARTATAQAFSGGVWRPDDAYRYVNLATASDPETRFADTCQDSRCQIVGDVDDAGAIIDAESRTHAVYVEDRWSPTRDLVIELGLRLEGQTLYYPDDLRGRIDPFTGAQLGDKIAALNGNLAPRVGVAWDPTSIGRARLYAHAGRYFELLGTNLIPRHFSRSTLMQMSPLQDVPLEPQRMGIDPELALGYLDEYLAGGEYEVLRGTTLGAFVQHRRLGRAIDDVHDGDRFVLTNPTTARRVTNAITLTAQQRFSRLLVVASYTRQRVTGTYQGIVDSADHTGPVLDYGAVGGTLPQDRPHDLKLDAAYAQPLGAGAIILGGRFRAQSGEPIAMLDGRGDPIVPFGVLGRTAALTTVDLHLAYRHSLTTRVTVELFADVANVFDDQAVQRIDSLYTIDDGVLGISGGTAEDLVWLKSGSSGLRNANFGKPLQRLSPRSVTFGARLTF